MDSILLHRIKNWDIFLLVCRKRTCSKTLKQEYNAEILNLRTHTFTANQQKNALLCINPRDKTMDDKLFFSNFRCTSFFWVAFVDSWESKRLKMLWIKSIFLSAIDHDCRPNANVIFIGRKARIFALEAVPEPIMKNLRISYNSDDLITR